MCVRARSLCGPGLFAAAVWHMGWEQAAHAAYYGMVGLQHRGQEGAGMVTGTIGHGREKGSHSHKVSCGLCVAKMLTFENMC